MIDCFHRDLDYQASSPDEKALVEACAKVGFIFTGDDNDIVTVRVKKTVFRRTNKVSGVVQWSLDGRDVKVGDVLYLKNGFSLFK